MVGFWEVIKFSWSLEGRALMMGLVALQEEEEQESLPFKDTARQWLLQATETALRKNWMRWHLDLGLPQPPDSLQINVD